MEKPFELAGDIASECSPVSTSWWPRAHWTSWTMLLITTLAVLMISIDGQILPAVLPSIKMTYGLSNVQAGLINTIFAFGSMIGAVGFGVASDLIGSGYRRGYTWIAAYALAVVGGLLTALMSGSFLWFQIWRIPMGLSRGGAEPVNVALVSDWWQKENRGFAVGVHHTGFPIGQFLSGVLIALVLHYGQWTDAFSLIPLIGVVVIVAQLIIGTRRNQEKAFAWMRANHLTTPARVVGERGNFQRPMGAIKAAFGHRNTGLAIASIFMLLVAELGIVLFMTSYLTEIAHLSISQAALISGVSGLTGWIGQVVWGMVSDRIGRKPTLIVLAIACALTTLLLLRIDSAASAWMFLLAWGLFRNAPFPVAYAMVIDSSEQAAGSGMGLMIGIAFGLAGMLVSPVSGYIIGHAGWVVHYCALAVMCLLAIVPLLFVSKSASEETRRDRDSGGVAPR
ncbi:MFS transporter (plasmid) [Paraburkholderia graminis]|uniref:MFS transporter n=1 Tax=Paraburkholderia graminis TaxID=60548 RepID=UPI000DEF3FB9|nr:MFS transporter [Paraburkholderia graminis]AXF12543.1 MFS transporter [Paraburkholderia graminis]